MGEQKAREAKNARLVEVRRKAIEDRAERLAFLAALIWHNGSHAANAVTTAVLLLDEATEQAEHEYDEAHRNEAEDDSEGDSDVL